MKSENSKLLLGLGIGALVGAAVGYLMTGEPVSYTHLDVYKRQLYTWVSSDAFEKNTLMTQNTYWLWQK